MTPFCFHDTQLLDSCYIQDQPFEPYHPQLLHFCELAALVGLVGHLPARVEVKKFLFFVLVHPRSENIHFTWEEIDMIGQSSAIITGRLILPVESSFLWLRSELHLINVLFSCL